MRSASVALLGFSPRRDVSSEPSSCHVQATWESSQQGWHSAHFPCLGKHPQRLAGIFSFMLRWLLLLPSLGSVYVCACVCVQVCVREGKESAICSTCSCRAYFPLLTWTLLGAAGPKLSSAPCLPPGRVPQVWISSSPSTLGSDCQLKVGSCS